MKIKHREWTSIVIATLIWSIAFNSLDKRVDNSIYTWIIFTYFCVMTGYIIGRGHVIKKLFDEKEIDELIDEYNENK